MFSHNCFPAYSLQRGLFQMKSSKKYVDLKTDLRKNDSFCENDINIQLTKSSRERAQ